MNKLKSALALSVCLVALASCDLSTPREKVVNPLIGQWKIDSVSAKDSNDFGVLLLAMSLQHRDSSNYDLAFTTDTMSLLQKDTTSKTSYHFDDKKSEVTLADDATIFAFQRLNDSLVTLTSKDSTVLFLRKR